MTDDTTNPSPRIRALLAREPDRVACPVPGCCERPASTAEFCRGHQEIVAQFSLWLGDLPNDTGSTFSRDRLLG